VADEDNSSESSGSEVGYRKPPVNTRFRKGESGNPNGRPRGSRNFSNIFAKSFRERVVISEHGKRKTITKLEAATKQLANKAASGDLAALRQAITIIAMLEGKMQGPAVPANAGLEDADRQVFMSLLRRIDETAKKRGINEERVAGNHT